MRYPVSMLLIVLVCLSTGQALPPSAQSGDNHTDGTISIDNTTYIDANSILMFVTNHGSFGRDLAGVFGYDYGTFFPYTSIFEISSGTNITSPLYAAGLWMGGKVNGEIRVTVAEYNSEYAPGPMAGGSYVPDRPEFRVYKLYADSLESNPNQDYLDWPVDQGAPVDEFGRPAMRGTQLLWSVFNDADPLRHDNDAGETDPLGIEIKQSVWVAESDADIPIVFYDDVEVTQIGSSDLSVYAIVVDAWAVTGHTYAIVFRASAEYGVVWDLVDMTTGLTVLSDQPAIEGETDGVIVDGLSIQLGDGVQPQFSSFEVVANGGGALVPSASGALASVGFPTPGDADPGSGQQLNGSRWAIHTADNGGSSGGGTWADYSAFLSRVTRDGYNAKEIGVGSYEMRFTGSLFSPGVGGSYAIEWFNDENIMWVPFELWRIGNTPDDPSDDVRLVPFVIDGGDDDSFGLESWGSEPGGTCHAFCEHSASPGDDDPFTDWVYWYAPVDRTPGEGGYLASEAQMLAGTFDASLIDREVFARTVLISPDAGEVPAFPADAPEQGTTFRITTDLTVPPDTFLIVPSGSSVIDTTVTPANQTIFVEYELVNNGGNTIDSCFLSLWTDPDLGGAGDDLVGSDSANATMYCYNGNNADQQYGPRPPAIGFKFLQGPSGAAGELPLYSMNKYINGTDPNNALEVFRYMKGLDGLTGLPYLYNGQPTRFVHGGNPVSGTGDIDFAPSDKRLMGSFSPFTFYPGDTQIVRVKMAVAPGSDRLNSLSILRDILAFDPDAPLAAAAISTTHPILPMPKAPANILIGQLSSHPTSAINPATVKLNDILVPDSTRLLASHPSMSGEVLQVTFRTLDLLNLFQPTESGQIEPFTMSFETGDGQAYEAEGTLEFLVIFIGDVNGDSVRNLTDLTLLVQYLFAGGNEPSHLSAGDLDCNGTVSLTDITRFVNALFQGGSMPDYCPQ